ncbi:glycosyltransferase [Vibrio harveyi]|uniref:glycosyltransferase n=1 Tax=Vibrio harveyi TaxID=669 RepID=UPI002119D5A3|nr:glycosyltransferase [Vibrio harveyi]MCQ9074154.1 glycosyltransferase [Vibrio harveyi]
MKTVMLITTDLYQGGVAESTRKLCKYLKENDYRVLLVSYDSTPVNIKVECDYFVNLNIPMAAGFSNNNIHKLYKKIMRWPGFFIALIRVLYLRVKLKPDCVFSMMYIPNLVNIITGKLSQGKIVISERQDPNMDLPLNGLVTKLLKFFYPYSDLIHANSKDMIKAISGFYNIDERKIAYFDNFFYLSELKERALIVESKHDDYFLNDSRKVIVTSGRLSKQKGHWHLINAMTELKDDYRLLILGEGDLKEELNLLVDRLNLRDSVEFFGNVSNPHSIVKRSHVFVFPSIWESFGNSLVEAMSLGVPVISTECDSGPGYIIEKGNSGLSLGKLAAYESSFHSSEEVRCSNEIVKAIRFLEDKNKYVLYSKKATERAVDFDVKTVGKYIDKVFF